MSADEAAEIARAAGRQRGAWDAEAAARGLVEAALDRGTTDNVSVVVVVNE